MDIQPGDIGFAKTNGIMGRAIRFGEELRWHRGSIWNHAFIVDRIEDGVVYVIQAEAAGVTSDKTLDSVAPKGVYVTMRPPQSVDVESLLAFARQEVGSHYGWLSIASAILDILTPGWFPSFRRGNSWICSAITAEALRAGGWLHRWSDIYVVTPAQLFDALT